MFPLYIVYTPFQECYRQRSGPPT